MRSRYAARAQLRHDVWTLTYLVQVLIDLFLVSRHVVPAVAPKDEDAPKRKGPPPATLATAVLDTLLCIMVDSSPAMRAFEEANGVRAVVRILKRAGTPRETRYVSVI